MTVHQTIEAKSEIITMTGAQMVVRALIDQGVDVLFGYPGGAVLPIYDALYDEDRLRHVLVRHEQGAAMRPKAMPDPPANRAWSWSRRDRGRPMPSRASSTP